MEAKTIIEALLLRPEAAEQCSVITMYQGEKPNEFVRRWFAAPDEGDNFAWDYKADEQADELNKLYSSSYDDKQYLCKYTLGLPDPRSGREGKILRADYVLELTRINESALGADTQHIEKEYVYLYAIK